MKPTQIKLGYEVGSGDEVSIPLKHLAITGQTQESGKTTTLEALITRSELTALAFITKRGEGSFQEAQAILPFFQERADWGFVESILESSMKQRMKFERAWIVKACRGAKTLSDVQKNIEQLQSKSKRAMDQDMFMLLGEYLDKVVPLIKTLPRTSILRLQPGLNVMDVRAYPDEMQMLVIASSLRYVHKELDHTIVIIPEAWKMIPQGKNTPVKVEAEKLAREGAGIRNYVWIDSQDMAGVDKLLLRAAAVWIIGVQRETNEIKRALANMPVGLKKPKDEQVATLKLGQFFVCYGDTIKKTYVQPAWLDNDVAIHAARTEAQVFKLPPIIENRPHMKIKKENKMENNSVLNNLIEQRDQLVARLEQLNEEIARLRQPESIQPVKEMEMIKPAVTISSNGRTPDDFEQLYQKIRERLLNDPKLLAVTTEIPEIVVKENVTTVETDDTTILGKIALLVKKGFFKEPRESGAVMKELMRLGMPRQAPPNITRELMRLAGYGYLTVEENGYREVRARKEYIR